MEIKKKYQLTVDITVPFYAIKIEYNGKDYYTGLDFVWYSYKESFESDINDKIIYCYAFNISYFDSMNNNNCNITKTDTETDCYRKSPCLLATDDYILVEIKYKYSDISK